MPANQHRAHVFIVVPAFNESRTIRGVVDELLGEYPNVIVVDDGSSDGTAESLRDSGALVLRHCANRGQGASLQTGIDFALLRNAEAIVTFDADGQHDVNDVAALLQPLFDGECDVALGSRFLGRASNMPVTRRLLLKLGILFTLLVSRVRATDVHNGLRAFSAQAASELSINMDRMAHASEIFDQIRVHGWRYKEIPVTIRYTKYSLAKGQTSWDALRIAFQVLLEKLRR
jgi:glycosyltransferase involved in cell wall biosynthesis